jgi:hypothetical protein
MGADPFSAELLALSEGGVLSLLLGADLVASTEAIVLPLLEHAAQAESDEVVEVVDGLLHLLDRYTAAADGTTRFLSAAIELALARLHTLPSPVCAAVGNLLRSGKVVMPIPDRYLLDEAPGVYLELHHSAGLTSAASSLEGGAFATLTTLTKALGVAVSDTSQSGFLKGLAFKKILRRIVWSLGALQKCEETSLVALKALCTHMAGQVWRFNRRTDAAALSAESIANAVADRLQTEFMMLMASLLVDNWHAKAQGYCEQSLRCFRVLIALLRQSDVVKFLPKILIVVDSALGGTSAAVRLAAVDLVATLCPLLPAEVLATNLSSLVVNLYPLLDDEVLSHAAVAVKVAPAATARTQLPSASLSTQGVARGNLQRPAASGVVSGNLPNQATPEERAMHVFGEDLRLFASMAAWPAFSPLPHSEHNKENGALIALFETCYAIEVSTTLAKQAKAKVVEVIRSLFLGRREDIQSHIQTVVYIPDLPELRDVHALHQQEVRALTLEQSLQLLCDMLAHTSVHVRLVAVNRLALLCQEYRDQLHTILDARSADTTASSAADHIVSSVLQALLRLCAREADARVLAACARCLGEIGAIDPSRVSVQLDASRSNNPSAISVAGADSTASQFPWKIEAKDLCLHFLESYLVPGQRSADGSAAQDKSSYAIQLLLRELAAAMQDGSTSSSAHQGNDGGMPVAMKDLLASKSILEVTEPFWYTSYTLTDNLPARVPPIYTPTLTFSRWMWLFTRYLISQSKGRLSSIFASVRGFVRLSNEMCQYMLPHLIYDVLVNTPFATSDGQRPSSSVPHPLKSIVQELCLVLRGSADSGGHVATESRKYSHDDQMCIQAVFTLLDTLGSWGTRCVQKMGSSYSRSSPYADIAKYNASSHNMDENGISRVKLLVDSVPTELLCQAALGVKAHTRALRYLEVYTRRAHRFTDDPNALTKVSAQVMAGIEYPPVPVRPSRKPVAQSVDETDKTGIWSPDRAGGMLPRLSAPHVDGLMTIFSSLEDPDSLQGSLVMNHVHGHAANPRHRILELELTDDWLGALLEYGLVHNGQQFSNSLHHYFDAAKAKAVLPGDGVGADGALVLHDQPTRKDALTRVPTPAFSPRAGDVMRSFDHQLSLSEIAELERRKLRCMVELGHYDAVIDQVQPIHYRSNRHLTLCAVCVSVSDMHLGKQAEGVGKRAGAARRGSFVAVDVR